jgi:uncharacterized membrane protein
MINVFVYTAGNQPETQNILAFLSKLKEEIPHNVSVIDINEDISVYRAYPGKTPVIECGPYHLYYPFSDNELHVMLTTAQDRQNRLIEKDPGYIKKLSTNSTITKADNVSFWLTNHYMLLLNTILIIFLGLPFLAPVLEKMNANLPARIIYKIYSPLCHQLAYRSWFLFGEQPAYPRSLAGLNNELSFEQVTGLDSHDVLAARVFIGNKTLGYKVAFCERDVAIYGGILFMGLLFAVTGRRLRSLPWYIWIIFGMIPMGIDGVSQLPSLIATHIAWLPIRESTPLLRTITGLLFGMTTAWYGFPLIEETMRDSRKALNKKFAMVGKA